jgi:hypothetical protein
VKVIGAAVDKLFDKLGNIGSGSPLSREVADLLFRWNLTSEEQPEKTLGKRFLSTWCLGKDLLTFGDSLATESDALFRVENGALLSFQLWPQILDKAN